MYSKQYCIGFSLIGLLFSLALSALLVLGLGQMYLSHNKLYRLNTAKSQLLERSQLAHFLFENSTQNAGFKPIYITKNTWSSISQRRGLRDINYQPHSDNLSISFISDGSLSDCMGHRVPKDTTALFEYYIDRTHTLKCATYYPSGQLKDVQPLIDNIALLKVGFGYADADGVIAPLTSDIKSNRARRLCIVQIALVFMSSPDFQKTKAIPSFDFLEKTYSPNSLVKNHPKRRLYLSQSFYFLIYNRL